MGQLPQITKFFDEHREKGLHIFNVLRKETPPEQIKGLIASQGINFTSTMFEGNDFEAYPSGAFPYTYVIGPDGKVKFQGDRATALKWMPVVETELKNVDYPFLGMRDVPDALDKAAKAYTESKFADAHEEAGEHLESEEEGVALKAAELRKKIDGRIARKQAAVEEAKSARRYHDAVRILEELSDKPYKGLEVYDKAGAELKELKKDKGVKTELKAWDALEKALEDNKKAKSRVDEKKNLIKVYEKHEGTAAAEEARRLAEQMK